jgi:opacity protein-like surface antigen
MENAVHEFPVAAALLLLASPALAQQVSEPVSRAPRADGELTAGVQYQTGEYGTGESIETSSAVAGARVVVGRVILSASLPYTRIDAPGNVVTGGGGLLGLPIIVDPSRPATRVRRQGLGDARLGAAWVLPVKALDLAAYGQVKLPTARSGLGTGKADYSVGAEAAKTFGAVAPFANVTYTISGNPDGYRLRDTWAGQAGLNAALGSCLSGQLAYGYAQNPSAATVDEQQLSARLTAGVSSKLSLSLQGGAGLSRSAPEAAAAVQLGLRLF